MNNFEFQIGEGNVIPMSFYTNSFNSNLIQCPKSVPVKVKSGLDAYSKLREIWGDVPRIRYFSIPSTNPMKQVTVNQTYDSYLSSIEELIPEINRLPHAYCDDDGSPWYSLEDVNATTDSKHLYYVYAHDKNVTTPEGYAGMWTAESTGQWYRKVSGTWQEGTLYKKISGEWKVQEG